MVAIIATSESDILDLVRNYYQNTSDQLVWENTNECPILGIEGESDIWYSLYDDEEGGYLISFRICEDNRIEVATDHENYHMFEGIVGWEII